jgi:hypothetical protein
MVDQVSELRRVYAGHEPGWAAQLGPRPADLAASGRWNELVGIAAAYRETYRISRIDPAAPLGPHPRDDGARAQAWTQITANWRPPVITSDDAFSANQQRVNKLRDQVREGAENQVEDVEALGRAAQRGC